MRQNLTAGTALTAGMIPYLLEPTNGQPQQVTARSGQLQRHHPLSMNYAADQIRDELLANTPTPTDDNR